MMSVESGDCIRGRGPGCCCGRSAARMSEPASHGRTLLARRELQLLLPSLEQNSLYVNSQVLVSIVSSIIYNCVPPLSRAL